MKLFKKTQVHDKKILFTSIILVIIFVIICVYYEICFSIAIDGLSGIKAEYKSDTISMTDCINTKLFLKKGTRYLYIGKYPNFYESVNYTMPTGTLSIYPDTQHSVLIKFKPKFGLTVNYKVVRAGYNFGDCLDEFRWNSD